LVLSHAQMREQRWTVVVRAGLKNRLDPLAHGSVE